MAAMKIGCAMAAVAALVTLTGCGGGEGDASSDPEPSPAGSTSAPSAGSDDFLAMLEELGGLEGVPEGEVLQAGEKFCAWRADGGSAELGRDPKTLELPDYFTGNLMKNIAFTAPRTLCPEALD